MSKKGIKFSCYDPLEKIEKNFKKQKTKNFDKKFDVNIYDMILIINDHPSFYHIIETKLKENNSNKKKYIFDTWKKLNGNYIKNLNWQYLKI